MTLYLPFTKVGKSVEGRGWRVNIKLSLGCIVTCLLNIPEDEYRTKEEPLSLRPRSRLFLHFRPLFVVISPSGGSVFQVGLIGGLN